MTACSSKTAKEVSSTQLQVKVQLRNRVKTDQRPSKSRVHFYTKPAWASLNNNLVTFSSQHDFSTLPLSLLSEEEDRESGGTSCSSRQQHT
ncbi:hypothetical protein INR49_023191 [Caranx melampygus]|nr:hypothetical protein INR49_023191 [Caranx melampygus]